MSDMSYSDFIARFHIMLYFPKIFIVDIEDVNTVLIATSLDISFIFSSQ